MHAWIERPIRSSYHSLSHYIKINNYFLPFYCSLSYDLVEEFVCDKVKTKFIQTNCSFFSFACFLVRVKWFRLHRISILTQFDSQVDDPETVHSIPVSHHQWNVRQDATAGSSWNHSRTEKSDGTFKSACRERKLLHRYDKCINNPS